MLEVRRWEQPHVISQTGNVDILYEGIDMATFMVRARFDTQREAEEAYAKIKETLDVGTK